MAFSAATGELRQAAPASAGSSRPFQLLLRLETWLDRRRSRRALYGMTDHALKDIGLTKADLGRADPGSSWQALLLPTSRR
jgi:uncharacterized protein YjiS (DUF1127 family)